MRGRRKPRKAKVRQIRLNQVPSSRKQVQFDPKWPRLDLFPLVHLKARHGCPALGRDASNFKGFMRKVKMSLPSVAAGG
jgi:hypothetical protein